MMRTRLLILLLPGALGLAVGAVSALAGPAGRTSAFFAIERGWAAHWPLESSKFAPAALAHRFEPFVPVWLNVEPHVKMRLDPYDDVSSTILSTGTWEPESWREIREHLHSGDTFVDVGAHIGIYSLRAASIVGPGGHVIAVEPNPETLQELRTNIDASGATGVISVLPVACSDAEATLKLFAAPRSNTGESSLSQANASQNGQATAYSVRALPLDVIIRNTGVSRVDVVKIDVEGAEYLVLKGAAETLRRYRPLVIVELAEKGLRAMGTSSAEITSLLRSYGYERSHRYDDANMEFIPNYDFRH
jgi:FkbM family methyltransferase